MPMSATAGALRLMRIAWHALRWPLLAVFVILEPIVRATLAGIALLAMLTTLFFVCFTDLPDVPFLGMLTVSLGCVVLLGLYYRLMRLMGAA